MNGWIVDVGLDLDVASIQVVAGSTIVTPASMCASLTRSRRTAAALGELGARVDARASTASPAPEHGDRLAVGDERPIASVR